jgi:predicted metal-binding membrane protein
MSTFSSTSFMGLSGRHAATTVVLLGLAIAAWVAAADWMNGMDMRGHFTAGSFGFFVALWVVMMAAMMFPSVWPAVAMFGLVVRRRVSADASPLGRSSWFVGGYLASWTVFGLVAFGLLALARGAGLDELSDTELARYVVAPAAFVAALYQVVPFKQSCLRNCRGPLSFFLHHWRDGRQGALVMGSRHGAYCVGCCWMLMVVLLAVGVMSITWMAFVSLAIAVEKLSPPGWSRVASGVLAVGLVALALVAIAAPSSLPGLGGMGGMAELSHGDEMRHAG